MHSVPRLSLCRFFSRFESIALGGASFLFVSDLPTVVLLALGLEVLDSLSNVAAYISTFGPSRARFLCVPMIASFFFLVSS